VKRAVLLLILPLMSAYPIAALSQSFCLPVFPIIPTGSFGPRIHPISGKAGFHQGIDLRARGSAVRSVMAGEVSACGYHRFLGNFVRICSGKVLATYGHLSRVFTSRGALVGTGEVIGISGSSGRVTGEHLHFSVSFRGQQVHPLRFLLFLQSCGTLNQ